MVRPIRKPIPELPSRTDTFSDDTEMFFAFIETFVSYLDGMADHLEDTSRSILAAAVLRTMEDADKSPLAGKAVGINAGGTALVGVDPSILDAASLDEAREGTITNKAMIAERTRQAIDAAFLTFSSRIKLGSVSANSASVTFGSGGSFAFDSSKYSDYELVISNLLPSQDARSIQLSPSDDAGTSTTGHRLVGQSSGQSGPVELAQSVGTATDETGLSGVLRVYELHEDRGAMFTFDGVFVNSSGVVVKPRLSGLLQQPSGDSPLNQLMFGVSGTSGTFQSGSITLYGITT